MFFSKTGMHNICMNPIKYKKIVVCDNADNNIIYPKILMEWVLQQS